MTLKNLGKAVLCRMLEVQVRRLRAKHEFKIVAVVGSIGKTSTKLAIAKTLEGQMRVRYQQGNYNDRLTVPLVLFNHEEPAIYNVFAWIRILFQNQRQLKRAYPYDVAVLELGIDGPGQMIDFAYLQPDLLVVSGIAAEHLEYFKTVDAVAHEELLATTFSKRSLLNIDAIAPEYLPVGGYLSYGNGGDYALTARSSTDLSGQQLSIKLQDLTTLEVHTTLLGAQGATIVLAAAAAGDILGIARTTLATKLSLIDAFAGRMQVLPGIQGSTLIDDTYNASPIAVKAALDVLYAANTSQRIAIIGSMNEMGDGSPALHEEVGSYCDPTKLDLVLVIGEVASTYLAPAAQKRGCKVETFMHPEVAGNFAKEHLQTGAVVLAKGSQNGVFAEEALIPLLANPADAVKLVRQSAYWKAKKQQSLPKVA